MLPALYDHERETLLRWAAMAVLGSLCVLPLTVPSGGIARAQGSSTVGSLPVVRLRREVEPKAARPRRDPFVPLIGALPATSDGGTASDLVLPPNLSAPAAASLAPTNGGVPVVRAVVLGRQSRALVDLGGRVEVVGVGDRLGNASIVRIGADGIVLEGGRRLPLAEARP